MPTEVEEKAVAIVRRSWIEVEDMEVTVKKSNLTQFQSDHTFNSELLSESGSSKEEDKYRES